jgi:hypothetical protein
VIIPCATQLFKNTPKEKILQLNDKIKPISPSCDLIIVENISSNPPGVLQEIVRQEIGR